MNPATFLRGLCAVVCMFMAEMAPVWAQATALQAEPAAEIPIEQLFRKSAYQHIVLSPDQKFMAAVTPVNGRQNLIVIDLDKRAGAVLTGLTDIDVSWIYWANNQRLLFTTGDQQGLELRSTGGLFAIDRDGKNDSTLVKPFLAGSSIRLVWRQTSVIGRVKGRADEVYVSANDRSESTQDVYRMNVVTGRKTLVNASSPGHVLRWVLDRDGVPRAALSMDAKRRRWWFSHLDGGQWKTLAEWDERLEGVVIPEAFDPENPRAMYVASNVGRDTLAWFRFDLDGGKLGELVYGDDRHDVGSFHLLGEDRDEGGRLIFDGSEEEPGKLLGLRYQADKPRSVWLDETARKTQAMVDAALPSTFNRFDVTQTRTLVASHSDVNPGEWHLFDKDKRTIEDTGLRVLPGLDLRRLQAMRPVSWTARDGLRIDGYLTLPRGAGPSGPVPLVLLPHGGPWVRDAWKFDREVQLLANRGFAVLQPNYRGSPGFGARHLRASYKEWGGAMIDDMIDGIEWTVKQGIADPARIGVYGASYGGYASLMALVKRPDLFKWGINYVGVTDMSVHQDTQPAQLYSDFSELAKALNGDQSADKALFEAQSPARQVHRIAAPVFHAYGGKDQNVDYANGRAIKAAFEKAGKSFEWMYVADEAHGYRRDRNVIDFYTRFERFIKANTPPPR